MCLHACVRACVYVCTCMYVCMHGRSFSSLFVMQVALSPRATRLLKLNTMFNQAASLYTNSTLSAGISAYVLDAKPPLCLGEGDVHLVGQL